MCQRYADMTIGDKDRYTGDYMLLIEILNRQGMGLFVDVLAEYVGSVVSKHELTAFEASRAVEGVCEQLRKAIKAHI